MMNEAGSFSNVSQSGLAAALSTGASIVKEGWLFKRGEHIKNWRSRYLFVLRTYFIVNTIILLYIMF